MEGALSKIATARGCIARNDIAEKSRQITWGMNIIQGLRTSLDAQKVVKLPLIWTPCMNIWADVCLKQMLVMMWQFWMKSAVF